MPEWEPLVIESDLNRGIPDLPPRTDRKSPNVLFKLFFTDEWLDTLIQYTNANAIKNQENEEASNEFRDPTSLVSCHNA